MKRSRLPIFFFILAIVLLFGAYVGFSPNSCVSRMAPDSAADAAGEAAAESASRPSPEEPAATPDGVRVRGAAPGEWTHDWDAARELAGRERLPLLALFTASDWNRWHKFLALRVLDTPEWREWAVRRRVVLAWMNLPNDESLLPAGARARNLRLARELGATAYPAALLVAPVAGTAIARYHVTDHTTAGEFSAWLQAAWLDSRPGGPKPLLSDEDRAALEALREEVLPLEKTYAEVLEAERAAHAALVEKQTPTDELKAWAKESDKRLEEARAPLDAVRAKINACYDKAMDAAVPPPTAP